MFSSNLAIDLGTANTLIYAEGKGIICDEPSVVVFKNGIKKPIAIGTEAKEIVGKTPEGITAVRPLKDGVIADFDATEEMLKFFIAKVHKRKSFISPRIIVGVPSGITQVEQRAVKDAALASGAREVYLVGEPMAAAIGVGLPVSEPVGNMIVDIGGGTTDVAVISLSGIVYSKVIRVGGDKMDEEIISYIKRKYNVMIGERTAEQIKKEIGTACPVNNVETMEIKGRDLISGIPKAFDITEAEIRAALQDSVVLILDAIKNTFENTPPELSADIFDKGIILTGGGALLKGLDVVIREQTGVSVVVSDNSLFAVVKGCGAMLNKMELLKKVSLTTN
ncbi:rod shape-determining protein [Thermodesulfovibrionales bacterium]|nr:rod shape-determining protein [Thermodesulfovibrionales bacterium]MCL0071252.1 rod shape-determining protein [Thermodesulfovibrionales bacterium]MCL0086009.1 rod shape-determining protein [Thermodesulfovibrionales bacterium]MCL0086558.1 rod shape-determining protein [Thermodesulfovibrionales bacterium]